MEASLILVVTLRSSRSWEDFSGPELCQSTVRLLQSHLVMIKMQIIIIIVVKVIIIIIGVIIIIFIIFKAIIIITLESTRSFSMS